MKKSFLFGKNCHGLYVFSILAVLIWFAFTPEVVGAIVASTFTTIAVFVPVLFVEEEAGQVFRDIAIASAVFLSLLVLITVIPSMSAKILKRKAEAKRWAWILHLLVKRLAMQSTGVFRGCFKGCGAGS